MTKPLLEIHTVVIDVSSTGAKFQGKTPGHMSNNQPGAMFSAPSGH